MAVFFCRTQNKTAIFRNLCIRYAKKIFQGIQYTQNGYKLRNKSHQDVSSSRITINFSEIWSDENGIFPGVGVKPFLVLRRRVRRWGFARRFGKRKMSVRTSGGFRSLGCFQNFRGKSTIRDGYSVQKNLDILIFSKI